MFFKCSSVLYNLQLCRGQKMTRKTRIKFSSVPVVLKGASLEKPEKNKKIIFSGYFLVTKQIFLWKNQVKF